MKITKLVHSCFLVEDGTTKILVDPGAYSWQDESVKTMDFSGITEVVITHGHPDHIHIDFAGAVHRASPNAQWYSTLEVADQLNELGIQCSTESQNDKIKFIASSHAELSPWFDQQPEHTSYLLCSDVLVSGDCQTLTQSYGARILAGAINGGPWGAVVGFAKMIESMESRPEIVIPLHDWHWNDEARTAIYAKLPEVMEKFNVKFVGLKNCVAEEV